MNDYKTMFPGIYRLSPVEKVKRSIIGAAVLAAVAVICVRLEFYPGKFFRGLSQLGEMLVFFFPPSHGGWFWDFVYAMGETLAMAFLGTLFGFILAFPLSFLAAKNTMKIQFVRNTVRRFFDVIRGIDALIWALMFVHVVGLGPFAGIMAICVSDMATLGKLFSEAIENVDTAAVKGAESTGANKVQVIRYAIIPAVLPVMLSNALYFFESNVRSASILGVLGAGGIGMQLYDRLRVLDWDQVTFIVIMILLTVAVIDLLSKELRMRIIANPEYRQ